jgi:hypothetical protein
VSRKRVFVRGDENGGCGGEVGRPSWVIFIVRVCLGVPGLARWARVMTYYEQYYNARYSSNYTMQL